MGPWTQTDGGVHLSGITVKILEPFKVSVKRREDPIVVVIPRNLLGCESVKTL